MAASYSKLPRNVFLGKFKDQWGWSGGCGTIVLEQSNLQKVKKINKRNHYKVLHTIKALQSRLFVAKQ